MTAEGSGAISSACPGHSGAECPEKRTQVASRKRKGSRGGRSPKFDREKYKGRNVVERAFNLMKQWRGLATRYDKLAVAYRAGVMLAVTHIGDTP